MKEELIDNTGSYIKIFLGILVALVLILATIPLIKEKGFDLPQLLIIVFAILLAMSFIWRRIRELKTIDAGFPLLNERLDKVNLFAAAKSFEISIWWLLAIILSVNIFEIVELNADQVVGVGIVGMIIIFGISWLWANSKEYKISNEKVPSVKPPKPDQILQPSKK